MSERRPWSSCAWRASSSATMTSKSRPYRAIVRRRAHGPSGRRDGPRRRRSGRAGRWHTERGPGDRPGRATRTGALLEPPPAEHRLRSGRRPTGTRARADDRRECRHTPAPSSGSARERTREPRSSRAAARRNPRAGPADPCGSGALRGRTSPERGARVASGHAARGPLADRRAPSSRARASDRERPRAARARRTARTRRSRQTSATRRRAPGSLRLPATAPHRPIRIRPHALRTRRRDRASRRLAGRPRSAHADPGKPRPRSVGRPARWRARAPARRGRGPRGLAQEPAPSVAASSASRSSRPSQAGSSCSAASEIDSGLRRTPSRRRATD